MPKQTTTVHIHDNLSKPHGLHSYNQAIITILCFMLFTTLSICQDRKMNKATKNTNLFEQVQLRSLGKGLSNRRRGD